MNLCPRRKLTGSTGIYFLVMAWPVVALASPTNEARITALTKDVQVLSAEGASRPAVLNDKVREGATIRTGQGSRAELTFDDGMVARLSANTAFTITNGKRNLDLKEGALVFSESEVMNELFNG